MLRHSLPLLFALGCQFPLHAQDAVVQGVPTHKLPMIVDESGGFQLCKATVDGKVVHLLVDSGAQVEIAMTKDWATAQGKELKEAGRADGIAGKAALFTTKFDSVDVGRAVSLSDFTANVMDLKLGIPFAKQADGTTPKVDGLLGSVFLRNAQAVINYEKQILEIPAKGTPPKAFFAQSLASGKRVIPLVKSSGGAAYVPIRFGEKEFLFIIDNAAGSNVMLPDVAAEIGLPMHEIDSEVKGAGNDEVKPKRGIADNIVVGDVVKLPKMDFMVMPSPGGDNLPEGKRFGGILGNSFLKQLKVCLDFQTYQMILPPLPNSAGEKKVANGIQAGVEFEKIPLTVSASGHCLLPVQVDGREGRFIVDTGAGTVAILCTDFAKALGKDLADLEGGTALGGAVKMHKTDVGQFKVGTTFPPLKLGGLQVVDLSKATVRVDGKDIAADGLLGVGMMDLCNAVFDATTSTLLIPPRGTPDQAFLETKDASEFVILPIFKGGMQMPFIDVTVHGKTRTFLIDTGAGPSSLEPDFAAELNLPKDLEGGSLDGAGGTKVENVYRVMAEDTLIGGKVNPGRMPFFVFSVRAKVQLPEGKVFGGILGVKTLTALGAFVDLGSYSLVVPAHTVRK